MVMSPPKSPEDIPASAAANAYAETIDMPARGAAAAAAITIASPPPTETVNALGSREQRPPRQSPSLGLL